MSHHMACYSPNYVNRKRKIQKTHTHAAIYQRKHCGNDCAERRRWDRRNRFNSILLVWWMRTRSRSDGFSIQLVCFIRFDQKMLLILVDDATLKSFMILFCFFIHVKLCELWFTYLFLEWKFFFLLSPCAVVNLRMRVCVWKAFSALIAFLCVCVSSCAFVSQHIICTVWVFSWQDRSIDSACIITVIYWFIHFDWMTVIIFAQWLRLYAINRLSKWPINPIDSVKLTKRF